MRDRTLKDAAESVKADTADLIDEAKHRAQAAGERVNRTIAGDHLTPGERISSHVREAGHELKAGIHKASREARDDDSGAA